MTPFRRATFTLALSACGLLTAGSATAALKGPNAVNVKLARVAGIVIGVDDDGGIGFGADRDVVAALRASGLRLRFRVEIDGVTVGGIASIEGLESAHALEIRADAKDPFVARWRKTVLDGKVDRKSISIIFMNDAGAESQRINLFDCFPTQWSEAIFDAGPGGAPASPIVIHMTFRKIEME